MTEVAKCATTNCVNNKDGKYELAEITLDDCYECEQCVLED